MKKKNTTLHTTIKTANDLAVTIGHFGTPAQANIPLFGLLDALDSIQSHYGWSDRELNSRSPKCLVFDICCYKEKNKIVQHFINNPTIKSGLKNEEVGFIADLCCYAHCAGALMGNDIQDAMWSVFNCIKLYIDKNWSEENALALFQDID